MTGIRGGSGFYQLVLVLRRPTTVKVGMHGVFLFPAGYYVYTGSAKRGLEARVARHLRRRKMLRWHIDFLLAHSRVEAVKLHGADESECGLSAEAAALPGSSVVADGFGSTDCRCRTHLLHFDADPTAGLRGRPPLRR